MVDFVGQLIAPRRPVWIGVAHGGVPLEAAALAKELSSRYVVLHEQIRELQSSIYLHCGPRALGAFVYPVDELGFTPHPPPRF